MQVNCCKTAACCFAQAWLSDACFKPPAPQLWVSTCERQGYNGNVTAGNLKETHEPTGCCQHDQWSAQEPTTGTHPLRWRGGAE